MNGALLDHLWQSTLFGAAVWSIALLLRNNSAAFRHWLWLLASLKFLLPFAALYSLGAATLGYVSPQTPPSLVGHALGALEPLVSPAGLTPRSAAAPDAGVPVIASGLFTVWILGSLWLALRWLRGWGVARSLSRAARRAPGTSPDTYVIDADIEPSVANVFRPVVLLPAVLLGRLPASQLDAVLAHEREHIARRDNLKAQLHALVEIAFWFHPLVWLIGRRLLDERERACDEAVVAKGHDPTEYAAGILEVCRHCATLRSPQRIGALAGNLTQRIRHILISRSPSSLGFTKAFLLTSCTVVLAVAPLAAGALDETAHRRAVAAGNAEILRDAGVWLSTSLAAGGSATLRASSRQILIRNSSLRELLAMVYGVNGSEVHGHGDWLDSPRYDLRVDAQLREPEAFDAVSLRPLVNKLLATRFGFDIYVGQECQEPCGGRRPGGAGHSVAL